MVTVHELGDTRVTVEASVNVDTVVIMVFVKILTTSVVLVIVRVATAGVVVTKLVMVFVATQEAVAAA